MNLLIPAGLAYWGYHTGKNLFLWAGVLLYLYWNTSLFTGATTTTSSS